MGIEFHSTADHLTSFLSSAPIHAFWYEALTTYLVDGKIMSCGHASQLGLCKLVAAAS